MSRTREKKRRRIRKPPVGARPGTLAIPAEAPAPAITVFEYDAAGVAEHRDPTLKEIENLEASGRNLWVDVQGLGSEEFLRGLARLFSIHPLALEDVVHVPIRPKAEPYEHNFLVVTRMLG
jgi:magnesium transporter